MVVVMRAIALALLLLSSIATAEGAKSSSNAKQGQEIEASSKPIPLHLSYGDVYTEAHARGDLPQLPITRSPTDKSWNNSIAICAVSEMDYTTDVREWVQFHRWLGVHHIFLADTGKETNRALRPQLRDFIKAGFVTLSRDAAGKSAISVYHDCMVKQRHKFNWLAFIDTDEFFIMRQPNSTLSDFLHNFRYSPGIAVHLIEMGSSGRIKRPNQGGVLRVYKECDPKASPSIKTIANTYFLANISPHPYNMEFRGDTQAVNERMTPVPWRNISELHESCQSFIAPSSLRLQCRPVPGAFIPHTSVDRIALYHYRTQSKEDFKNKVQHFAEAGENEAEAWQFFKEHSRGASSRDGACFEPIQLANKCCRVPQFKYTLP